MKAEDILAFVKAEMEPLTDYLGNASYRCAAYLSDGLYLPCVLVESSQERVKLAVKRFQETEADSRKLPALRRFGHGMHYEDIVRSFTTRGNRVNDYDIARLEHSPFALPLHILKQIHAETSMGWTQFTATVQDGKEFSFGTSFYMEFFQMPEGYRASDVVSVVSHQRLPGEVLREKPFFVCYIDGL